MNSLELNWIRKVDKSLVNPKVVYSSIDWCGGQYFHPEEKELCIDGRYYDLHCGLIEISIPFYDYRDVAETISHEWRHHWQWFNVWDEPYRFEWPKDVEGDEYDKAIVKYFTLNPLEMDALRFSYKHATIDELWKELLYKYLC